MNQYTRKRLIRICQDGVVNHKKWNNRDSFNAQQMINSIYEGLTAEFDFKIDKDTDEDTIWINFINIDLDKLCDCKSLEICDIDDYFRDCDPKHETEMFEGEGINFESNWCNGFMPTRKRLNNCKGEDWY